MSTTQEKRNSILKDLKNLLIWISIALIIRWQVIEPRWIPSGSMLPTLQIQDKILVEKITPKITSKSNLSTLKNKIVVFNVPEQLINAGYEADTALIKRVIGIPGDKVEVREGNLYLNLPQLPLKVRIYNQGILLNYELLLLFLLVQYLLHNQH